jgi:hypothetical protein
MFPIVMLPGKTPRTQAPRGDIQGRMAHNITA